MNFRSGWFGNMSKGDFIRAVNIAKISTGLSWDYLIHVSAHCFSKYICYFSLSVLLQS